MGKIKDLEIVMDTIHRRKLEAEVLTLLAQWYERELEQMSDLASERGATLSVIQKINAQKNKDIDSLCEECR